MKNTLMLLSIIITLFTSKVFSINIIQKRFVDQYPQVKGTSLDSCSTCHSSMLLEGLNPYGKALKDHNYDYEALEYVDSDGDGFKNLDEILNLENPGSQTQGDGVMIFNSAITGNVYFDHTKHVLTDLPKRYQIDNSCKQCHEKRGPLDTEPFKKFADDRVKHSPNDLHGYDGRCVGCHYELKQKSGGVVSPPTDCHECHRGFSGSPPPTLPPANRVIAGYIAGTIIKGVCNTGQCLRYTTQSYNVTTESGVQCNNLAHDGIILSPSDDFEVIARNASGRYRIARKFLGLIWSLGSCKDDFWVMLDNRPTPPPTNPPPPVGNRVLTENIQGTNKQGICNGNICVRRSDENVTITRVDGSQCYNNGAEMRLYTFVDFEVMERDNRGRYRIQPTVLGAFWKLGDCGDQFWVKFAG